MCTLFKSSGDAGRFLTPPLPGCETCLFIFLRLERGKLLAKLRKLAL